MSPAEKMDEIVRLLEEAEAQAKVHDDGCTCGGPYDYCGCAHEAWGVYEQAASRALTLARELRDGAVEVRAEAVEPDDTACSCAKARSYEVHHACGHVYKIGDPALLILSEHTP